MNKLKLYQGVNELKSLGTHTLKVTEHDLCILPYLTPSRVMETSTTAKLHVGDSSVSSAFLTKTDLSGKRYKYAVESARLLIKV